MQKSHTINAALICLLQCIMSGALMLHAQGFVTNGSASSLSGNCYQLTPDVGGQAGTVFSSATIDLTQPFSLNVVMEFGCKDANGADGIVFILATSNTALGVGGGEIGYGGITPSIAIEYDDYQNGWGDPAQDHMAVISNGSLDHNAGTNLVGPVVISQIEDCEPHCFFVTWDPVTQSLLADLDGWEISYSGDIINTIFGGNPNVYYGFSAGTGSLSNPHVVCIGPPVVDPMDDVTICSGETAQLEADGNGIAWLWANDPTLSDIHISDPEADPVQTTTYTVTIDYPCSGIGYDTVVVTVIPAPTGLADNNGPLCAGDVLMLTASGGLSYTWSGPLGFFSSNQNPQINNTTAGHAGTYTVTVTDGAGCTTTVMTDVIIHVPETVLIDPPGMICENGAAVQLTGTPPGGIWSGDVNNNGTFDPVGEGAGFHDIYYTVTDGNGCSDTGHIIVEVVPNTPALIIPDGPFCLNDPVQILSASPGGGEWGDAADHNGHLDPAALGAGVHLVTYTYSDQNGCFDAELYIEIFAAPDVEIDDVSPVCPNDSAQSLSVNETGGLWGGILSTNGMYDPGSLGPGTYLGTYTMEDVNGCMDADTVEIVILPVAPMVSNFTLICDSTAAGFVVTFFISGGDTASYTVNGMPGGVLVPGDPYTFISDTIGQGGSYNFVVDDGQHCDPTIISGSYSCSCATQSGDMDTTLIQVCAGDSVVVLPPAGTVMDPDDIVAYYLHHGSSNLLTQVLAVSSTGVFNYFPGIIPGVTYYISAVVGNAGSPPGVDLNDPCLSVAPGTPVVWEPLPAGYLTAPTDVCIGETFDVTFSLTGTGPFDVVMSDGIQTDTLFNVVHGHSIQMIATQTTMFAIHAVYDKGGPGCGSIIDTSVVVTVHGEDFVQASAAICTGDSILIGGEFISAPGVYTNMYLNQFGCDSIEETTLVVYPLTSTDIHDTSCDTSQVGVFSVTYADINGCDSIVNTYIAYALADTTYLFNATCDTASAGTFTYVYQSHEGCDSFIIEAVALHPSNLTEITSETCDSSEAGLFTATLSNIFGCDSIVVEDVVLMPSWDVQLTSQTCDPAMAGVFSTPWLTAAGCDSVVTETVSLLASDTTFTEYTTCDMADVGVSEIQLINMLGCDSLIVLVTTLAPWDICNPVVVSRNVFIPNVFSPNGDGVNDVFTIYADPSVVTRVHFLRVFNRWGGLIGEWTDLTPGAQEGWDGTYREKQLDPAVFVWIAEIEYFDGVREMLHGDVSLLR